MVKRWTCCLTLTPSCSLKSCCHFDVFGSPLKKGCRHIDFLKVHWKVVAILMFFEVHWKNCHHFNIFSLGCQSVVSLLLFYIHLHVGAFNPFFILTFGFSFTPPLFAFVFETCVLYHFSYSIFFLRFSSYALFTFLATNNIFFSFLNIFFVNYFIFCFFWVYILSSCVIFSLVFPFTLLLPPPLCLDFILFIYYFFVFSYTPYCYLSCILLLSPLILVFLMHLFVWCVL